MFESAEMLYLYVETPLHAGSGSSVGVVDLPIQRERVTQYPLVQASGIKGKLRAEASARAKSGGDEKSDGEEKSAEKKPDGVEVVFGSERPESGYAGALSPGDARLLLFPVRSLAGVFAWTTSGNVLARFKRDLQAAGKGGSAQWAFDKSPDDGTALTITDSPVVVNGSVVLEEFAFTEQTNPEAKAKVKGIADWLADNALPQTEEYRYFREKLRTSLVILPEDAFRDFTLYATEVVARIRIDQSKKTVAPGALWTEEHLPSDTVLYVPLHASRPRTDNPPAGLKNAEDVLGYVRELARSLDRIQLGGDETVGRGIVKLHMAEKAEKEVASQ
jgi:CRISPR-associated protein Cmr4